MNSSNPINPINPSNPIVLNVADVMYDSILFNQELADQKAELLKNLLPSGLGTKIEGYCLVTIHRAENTNRKENLSGIMEALEGISRSGLRVVFPGPPQNKKEDGRARRESDT
jgi:UDP-GlcNAc3NAcA epimerase